MIRIFAGSFSLKGIFQNRSIAGKSFLFYFVFLILLVSFPLNYQIVKTGGWDLYNFTAGMRAQYPDWLPTDLPDDIEITKEGMLFTNVATSSFTTANLDGATLNIIFMPEGAYEGAVRALVFYPQRIVYYEEGGAERLSTNYQNISSSVRFNDLMMLDQSIAVDRIATMIDEAFSAYAVFKSVTLNIAINLAMNSLLALVVGAIFIFIRIQYQRVTTFADNLKIIISSMTIPAIVGFTIGIVGVIEINAFTSVLFQFLAPLIAILAIYKGVRKTVSDEKR